MTRFAFSANGRFRGSRSAIGLILFLALLGMPLLEIAVFIQVGERIGIAATIGGVVMTAIAGATLLRHQGLATLRRARRSLHGGRFPVTEVFDGVCLLLAGALLLTPGFVTDTAGLLLFVPGLRALLRRRLARHLAAGGGLRDDAKATIIEGEYDPVGPEDDGAGGGGRIPHRRPRGTPRE